MGAPVDALGLTNVEYALAMLLELEIVSMDQVQPFLKQFCKLDMDNSGRLCSEDLKLVPSVSTDDLDKLQSLNGKRAKTSRTLPSPPEGEIPTTLPSPPEAEILT